MNEETPGIRRLCVAVDLERCSGSDDGGVEVLRMRLSSVLWEACALAGLDRMLLNTPGTGKGEVALLPVGIDEPRVLSALVDALIQVLRRINTPLNDGSRVRLRVAVHEGITILIGNAFAGNAVVKTCRLRDSTPLHLALTRNPHADLAVLLSEEVFEDVARFDQLRLPVDLFQRVEVGHQAKNNRDVGWIFIPGKQIR